MNPSAKSKLVLVWLKRDLRTSDHEAFARAIETGLPIYAFYLFEPGLLSEPDSDIRHLRFIWESLEDLNKRLRAFHAYIHIHYEDALSFFRRICESCEVVAVYSHQETGNQASFQRDIEVAKFLKSCGISWYEYKTSYIVRGLISGRVGWKEKWTDWMELPSIEPDWKKVSELGLFIHPGNMRSKIPAYQSDLAKLEEKFLKFRKSEIHFQKGGETEGREILRTFLETRYKKYSGCISKPEESRTHCSRLSPYLTWGNLSARQVYQKTMRRRNKLGLYGKQQLDRFLSRLAWRDHMIQKFESECRIEFENFNPAYDVLKKERRDDWLQAWQEGRTGFPLVDASMRCLNATGYLNFRMRAMLVSFLTMILWQDWRWGVHHMARQFLDYEPGIHYFQFQMQAGTVGNHQIRIYNPYKQIADNDPEAVFIRRWIPELENLPVEDILNWGKESPGLFSACTDYPQPILDFKTAYHKARDTMFSLQKSPEVQKHLARIREIHIVDRKERSFQ